MFGEVSSLAQGHTVVSSRATFKSKVSHPGIHALTICLLPGASNKHSGGGGGNSSRSRLCQEAGGNRRVIWNRAGHCTSRRSRVRSPHSIPQEPSFIPSCSPPTPGSLTACWSDWCSEWPPAECLCCWPSCPASLTSSPSSARAADADPQMSPFFVLLL